MAQIDYQSLLAQIRDEGLDTGEFIRNVIEHSYQQLIDAGLVEHIGAGPHERNGSRRTQRNGSRKRTISTRGGDIEIALPKLRKGSYYPEFLEKRRRVDRALSAVIMTAYIKGISTRKVDKLVESLGVNAGISKSEVSRICKGIDAMVSDFRSRDLFHTEFPYLFIDATYLKARNGNAVRSRAVAVAMAVNRDGHRELLGLSVGHSEEQGFWEDFLRSLTERGLSGVRLVISDGHKAIGNAVARLLPDAAWQTCRVHFERNLLRKVKRADQRVVAAGLASVFAQPDRESAIGAYHHFADRLVINDNHSVRFCDKHFGRSIDMTIWYWRCQIGHRSASRFTKESDHARQVPGHRRGGGGNERTQRPPLAQRRAAVG